MYFLFLCINTHCLQLWVQATNHTDIEKIHCFKSCKQLAAWIFLDCYQDFRCERLFSIALKDVVNDLILRTLIKPGENKSMRFQTNKYTKYLTPFHPVAISNINTFNVQIFTKYSKNSNYKLNCLFIRSMAHRH